MLEFNDDEVVDIRSTPNSRGATYRFVSSQEAGKQSYLELSMTREQVIKDLDLQVKDGEKLTFWASFVPAKVAAEKGLESAQYVTLAAPWPNKPSKVARAKGASSVALRLGTYDWSEEQIKDLRANYLSKEVIPQEIVLSGQKALLLKMPPYTEI